MSTIWLYYQ